MIKKDGPSIKDIAKIAGVSAMTVSRVINSPHLVSNKTKKKVSKLLRSLNYRPNLLAKSLKSSSTRTIGILLTASYEDFQQNIIHGAEEVLRENSFKILFGMSNDKVEIENYYLDIFVSNKVDGIIIYSSEQSDGFYISDIMNKFKIPVVQVNNFFDNFQFNYVLNNNRMGIKILAKHLLEAAGKNIAYLSGPITSYTGHMRLQGFKEFLLENNINYNHKLIKIGDWSLDGGKALSDELLEGDLKFSSILASNYLIALGFLKSANIHGIKIPNDIKIAAFDDFTLNVLLSVPLTTLSEVGIKIGREAAKLLLNKIESNDTSNFKKIIVGGKLIKRISTSTE